MANNGWSAIKPNQTKTTKGPIHWRGKLLANNLLTILIDPNQTIIFAGWRNNIICIIMASRIWQDPPPPSGLGGEATHRTWLIFVSV